jgi:hypothetical protein
MMTHFRGVILVWFRGNCFRVAPFVFSFFFSFGFVFVVLSFSFWVGGICLTKHYDYKRKLPIKIPT